jgi:hypothetical protein
MDDDVAAVSDLVRGLWVGLAMGAMVDLRIADHTRERCRLTELATRTGCPPRQLTRLLHTLRDAGLVDGDDHGWQATDLGLVLASDHPSGLHRRLTSRTWAPTLAAWSHLSEALTDDVRTFGRPVEASTGESFWQAMNDNPVELATFNANMAGRGRDQATSLLEATDVAEVGRVVDVGAGKGATLAALLPQVPGLRGVVADRPAVLPEAVQNLAEHGVADRCEALPADFFDAVPAGGDAYVLGNILHDCPTTTACGSCRSSARPWDRAAGCGCSSTCSIPSRRARPGPRPRCTCSTSTCWCCSVVASGPGPSRVRRAARHSGLQRPDLHVHVHGVGRARGAPGGWLTGGACLVTIGP